MDPLLITSVVLTITATSIKIARSLNDVKETWKHAERTITAISSQAMNVSASLTQIQDVILRDTNSFRDQLSSRPELVNILESALNGCRNILEVIDNELEKLMSGNGGNVFESRNCQYLWNESLMQNHLSRLRGQQAAITLLLQAMQAHSNSELTALMRDHVAILQHSNSRVLDLRRRYPHVTSHNSIFELNDETSMRTSGVIITGETEPSHDTLAQAHASTSSQTRSEPPSTSSDVLSLTDARGAAEVPSGSRSQSMNSQVDTTADGELRSLVQSGSADLGFRPTLPETQFEIRIVTLTHISRVAKVYPSTTVLQLKEQIEDLAEPCVNEQMLVWTDKCKKLEDSETIGSYGIAPNSTIDVCLPCRWYGRNAYDRRVEEVMHRSLVDR